MPAIDKNCVRPWVFLPGFAQGEEAFADVIALMDVRYLLMSSDGIQTSSDNGQNSCNINSEEDIPCYTHCWGGGSFDEELSHLEDFLRKTTRSHNGKVPIVVSYSMGGRMALSLLVRCLSAENATSKSLDFPFAGLVLESPGLGPVDEWERTAFEVRNREWADRLLQDGPETFFTWWESLPLFASQMALPAAVRERIRRNRLAQDPNLLAKQLVNLGAQHMPLQSRTLAAVQKAAESGLPILYICGELDKKYSAVAALIEKQCRSSANSFDKKPPSYPISDVCIDKSDPSSATDSDKTSPSSVIDITGRGESTSTSFSKIASHNADISHFLKVEKVPNAGHNVHLEQLPAFFNLLHKFVFDYFPNEALRVE